MSGWVALLRGVNVNGITIRSADLRALFESLGFVDVRTVLASGNVVFSDDAVGGSGDGGASGDPAALKARIEAALGERFGYDAWIVLVPHDDLAGIVDGYPFPQRESHHAYIVFGSDPAALDDLVADFAPDDRVEHVERNGAVVAWSCPKGSSTDTPFAKRVAQARFKRTTTTRNLNTLRKLL